MLSPRQTFDGSDLYPEISDKAAIVSFNIAKTYHPFIDGNKRAAAISLLATCYLNGFVPMLTQADLVAVIMLVVQGDMEQRDWPGRTPRIDPLGVRVVHRWVQAAA